MSSQAWMLISASHGAKQFKALARTALHFVGLFYEKATKGQLKGNHAQLTPQ